MGFGVQRDKPLRIGNAAGHPECAIAGLDAFAGVGPAIALADQTVQGSQLLIHHVSDVDKDIIVVSALGVPDLSGNSRRAGSEEEDLGGFVGGIAVAGIHAGCQGQSMKYDLPGDGMSVGQSVTLLGEMG